MIILEDNWNVVVVGKWNKYILSPEWCAKNIFEAEKVQLEFGINIDLPPRYSANNVRMVPSEDIVVFSYLDYSDETINKLVAACTALLTKLPFTPIKACGINFGFTEEIHRNVYADLFNFQDDSRLIEYGSVINNKTITRKLDLDGKTLNLIINESKDKIVYDFNFHHDVSNCDEAILAVSGIKGYLSTAHRILDSVYNISMDQED